MRVIRGQRHSRRCGLPPARDGGGQSTSGGLCHSQHSVLSTIVEPTHNIRASTRTYARLSRVQTVEGAAPRAHAQGDDADG